jgi:uncharacterized protein (TIGR02453 family)
LEGVGGGFQELKKQGMEVQIILNFLSDLKENNNREWFAENRARYEQAKSGFEEITTNLIAEISQFDEDIKSVQLKECLFRIYRDIRFHDKTPYKTHMGAYIASHGGRKSPRGGYYLHLEPGSCFIAVGIWMPEPAMLKELRTAVYENIDEFKEIINEKTFKANFNNAFEEQDMLKTAPKGFPKDFEDIYFIKLKHYIVDKKLDDKFFQQKDYLQKIVAMFRAGYPMNKFLNYTVDEVMNY